jgi:hypothetical protein
MKERRNNSALPPRVILSEGKWYNEVGTKANDKMTTT